MNNKSEIIEPSPSNAESPYDEIAYQRELAEYVISENLAKYTALFVDPEQLYSMFPPKKPEMQKIKDPHITVAYKPDANKLLLDSLGSNAAIRIVGYGNDGQNEGLLVEVVAEDPAIQKALDERVALDRKTGETKRVPTHITLSIAEGAKAVDTMNLTFKPLEEPIEIKGTYGFFGKDGDIIYDKKKIDEMKLHN